MPALDPRTIVLVLAAIGLLQAIVLTLFARLVRRRYMGLDLWVWGCLANAAGFVLLGLGDSMPAGWSVIAGNGALIAAVALALAGLNRFLGRPRPGQERVALGVLALGVAALAPLTYGAPSVGARTAVVNLALAALNLLCAWSLLRGTPPHLVGSYRFTMTVFIVAGLWHLLRAELAATGGLSDAGPGQTVALLVALPVLLLWLAGAVAMIVQRLIEDLRAAQASELAAHEAAMRDANRRAEETRELLEALTAANRIVREREQIFRLTFDSSPLGAALLELDGRFIRVNEALCAATGYSQGELLRRDMLAILHPEQHARARSEVAALLAGAERASLEARALRADGAPIWLQLTAGLVRDGGETLHVLALAEDITARKEAEQRLRTIERQQQLVLRNIPDQFWLKDVAGRYVLASSSLAGFHGRSPAEFIGRTADDVFPPELGRFIRAGDDLIRAGQEYDVEVLLQDHKGAPRWLATSRAPVYDDDGSLIGIMGVGRDITARKEAEEALRQSRARLELALWGAELGLWDWHIPSGAFEHNAQLAALIGLAHAELDPPVEVWRGQIHPEDLPAIDAAFQEAIEGRAEGIDVEFRIMHRDGAWRWQAARGRAVERDEGGRAARLVGVTRDITKRREAEEQLRAREALLRSVSDNLPDGLIYQIERRPDGSGRFHYVSAGVETLWAVTPDEVYANPEALWSRIHPADRPGFEQAAGASQRRLSRFEIELRVCLPDGRTRWSYSRSTPLPLPDGGVLRSGVELDITARKEAEASLRRRVTELTALYQITQALTAWTSLADGLAVVARLLGEIFAPSAVTLWDYDQGARRLRPLAACPPGPAPQPSLGLAELRVQPGLLERKGAGLAALDPGHPLLGGDPGGPPRQCLVVPLRTRNDLAGLLCLSPTGPAAAYTAEDIALAETVGGVLASALENARLFAQARTAAAEQERRRLARELHDSVSQALLAANRVAEMLPQLWELDPDEGRQALADLRRFTTGALDEMRALLVELRPPALLEAPLHETLGVLAPTAKVRGVAEVQTAFAPAPMLPPDVQVALYRVAQEALNNVIKHARARRATVTLAVEPPHLDEVPWEGEVAVTVSDDGRGFAEGGGAGERYGLATMRERAAEIGAALEVASAPGAGTRVTIVWRGAARRPAEPAALAV